MSRTTLLTGSSCSYTFHSIKHPLGSLGPSAWHVIHGEAPSLRPCLKDLKTPIRKITSNYNDTATILIRYSHGMVTDAEESKIQEGRVAIDKIFAQVQGDAESTVYGSQVPE